MARLRRIIFDQTFEEQARIIEPDARRLDDAIEGAIWAISDHPDKLPVIDRTLRVAFTDPFPNMPAMRIYFSMTSDEVCTVHWIERLEEDDEFLGM